MTLHAQQASQLFSTLRRAPWGWKIVGRRLARELQRRDDPADVCAALDVLEGTLAWLKQRSWTRPKVDQWLARCLVSLNLMKDLLECQQKTQQLR